MRVYLLVLLVAAAVTYLLTPVARWVALRTGAITALRDQFADAAAKAPSSDIARAHRLSESLLVLVRRLEQRGASTAAAADVRDRAGEIVDAVIPLERAARPS